MKKHIIFLLLFVFAFSCKTTRTKTELQVETNAAARFDVSSSTASTEVKVSGVKIIDKSTSQKVTTWEANTKVFSAPDSTGKQHLQSETSAKGQTVEGEQKNIESNKKDSSNVSNKSISSDNSKLKTSVTTKTKTDKKEEVKTPSWLGYLLWSIVAACGLIGYFALRKYKIL